MVLFDLQQRLFVTLTVTESPKCPGGSVCRGIQYGYHLGYKYTIISQVLYHKRAKLCLIYILVNSLF